MKTVAKYMAVLSICFALCVAIIAVYFNLDTNQDYFESSHDNTHTTETVKITSPSKSKPKKKVKKNNSSQSITYILNTNTHRFHYAECQYVDTIADHNSETYTGNRDSLTAIGYIPCKICKP